MNIRDIAEMAGVSPATVSKVIHHKDKGIRDSTRQKVLAIIEKYQYRPYQEILQEHARQSRIVGIVTDIDNTDSMCFLSALTKEFAKSGYALLVLPYASDAQAYLMDTIKQQHAEAILALTKDPPRSLTAAASSLPIFWPTSQKSPAAIPLPSIKEEAAYHMINYLLSLGHRHILGISKDGSRLWPKGYERALQEAQLPAGKVLDAEVLDAPPSFWLPKECTAILCSDWETAALTQEELRSHGVRIPQDVSLACLGSKEDPGDFSSRITTAWINWPLYAAEISSQILNRLDAHAKATPPDDDLRIKILPRGSTQPPPQKGMGQKLIVVGGINMDCNLFLPHLPVTGENLTAEKIMQSPGGKGANQAVGAARLGAETYLIGMMGKDAAAQTIFRELQKNSRPPGWCFIRRVPGYRHSLHQYHVKGGKQYRDLSWGQWTAEPQAHHSTGKYFADAHYCLLSTEIPMPAIEETLRICRHRHIPVFVKPANIHHLPAALLPQISYLLPSRRGNRSPVSRILLTGGKSTILPAIRRQERHHHPRCRWLPALQSGDTTVFPCHGHPGSRYHRRSRCFHQRSGCLSQRRPAHRNGNRLWHL